MGEISMMPEGLVKISQVVKTQVESQIKVRDFSKASVTIAPADFASWADARSELVTEKKRPLKAQMEAEIAAVEGDEAIAKIRANYDAKERALENEIDHTPLEMHLSMAVSYNFLTK